MKKTLIAALLAIASFAAHANQFAVQLGTFATQAEAQNWVLKLVKIGVPAYAETRGDKVLLRAGPFENKDAAQAAIPKIEAAGLGKVSTPTLPKAEAPAAPAIPAECKPAEWLYDAALMRDRGMREHDVQINLFGRQITNADSNKAYDLAAMVFEQGANMTADQLEKQGQQYCDTN